MPYFITDKSPDCNGFATVKEDGEVIGCHKTKQDAIDQMVAVSIAEDIEPGGERALPDNYRPALSPDVPEGRACGNCYHYDETNVQGEGEDLKAYCHKWDAYVNGGFYCNAWQPEEEDRKISFEVPVYIRTAARKGLDYYGQGLAGDGLTEKTVREGRDLARGEITEDKIVRSNAWAQRHAVDLQAPKNSDADNEDFPGAGAVAHYLWGINPLNPQPARDFYERNAEHIKSEHMTAERAPAPPKDQIVGSDKNPKGSAKAPAGSATIELTEAIETGLKNKVTEHNEKLDGSDPNWKRATVGQLRSVFRRGAGAYSTSHRPGVTRDQWAYARVNAFLYLLRNGRPQNPKYITDNDLLPKDHPRSTRTLPVSVVMIDGMSESLETRRIQINDFELREGPTGDGMSFTGYAAVFDSDSEPLPFIERIAKGAFKKSLKSRMPIKMYMNHDSSMLLASTRSRTLRLQEDSRGLKVEADLPDTTVGRDLSVLMKRGDVDSMSFGFSVPSGGDKWSDDGMSRELRQVRLHEVSVVTGFPAYTATSASVRSLDILAERTGVDADKLAEAITMLEAGGTLSDESADLLSNAVGKLRAEPAKVPSSVNLLNKHLELLKNY